MATGSWTGTSPRGIYKPAMNEKEGTSDSGAWKDFDTSLTNIHNKLWRDAPINVKSDYGAVGDDSTDDTIAIQNAIDAAESSGSEVYLSPGVYKITSALTIQHPMIFRGAGSGRGIVAIDWDVGRTVIHNVGTSNNAIEISVEDPSPQTTPLNGLTLRDFDVEGAGSGATSGHGIVFAGLESNGALTQIDVHNISSYSNKQDGFRIEGVSFLFEWLNCYASSNGGSGMRFVAAGAGVPGQTRIIGGLFYNNTDSQLNIEAGGSYDIFGMSLSDTGSPAAGTYGLEIAGGAKVRVWGGFFEGNDGGGDVYLNSSQSCQLYGVDLASGGTDTIKINTDGNRIMTCLFSGSTKQVTLTATATSNFMAWGVGNPTVTDGGSNNQQFSTTQETGGLGTAAAPFYSFVGDPNTGIYRPTGDRIGFSANGTEILRIGPSGIEKARWEILSKSANYEMTATDYAVTASGNGTTITLPENAPTGTKYLVKRNDAANAITVSRKTADTIDGAASKSLDSNYAWIEVISNGANYFIVSEGGTVS